jgi:HAD superfamily hydrolase (TIGR01509 family)
MKNRSISFIYFDVGGVVIKDFNGTKYWEEMCESYGMNEEEKLNATAYWKAITQELCTTLPVDDIIPTLRARFHANIPENYSLLNAFVDQFDQNKVIWPLLKRVRKTHKIGLLTNMYPSMYQLILDKNLLPPIKWDVIVESTQVGFAKPNPQIFTCAQQTAHTQPENILFIDDNQKNVDAALNCGWNALKYDVYNREENNEKILENLY